MGLTEAECKTKLWALGKPILFPETPVDSLDSRVLCANNKKVWFQNGNEVYSDLQDWIRYEKIKIRAREYWRRRYIKKADLPDKSRDGLRA